MELIFKVSVLAFRVHLYAFLSPPTYFHPSRSQHGTTAWFIIVEMAFKLCAYEFVSDSFGAHPDERSWRKHHKDGCIPYKPDCGSVEMYCAALKGTEIVWVNFNDLIFGDNGGQLNPSILYELTPAHGLGKWSFHLHFSYRMLARYIMFFGFKLVWNVHHTLFQPTPACRARRVFWRSS